MTENNLENLIKKDQYQVFLVASRAHMPSAFFWHGWFVLNKKGVLSRWEIRHFKNNSHPEFGHIFLNNQPPFEGITSFLFLENPKWPVQILGMIEGDENSRTKEAIDFIEKSGQDYPYRDRYEYYGLGINSNTYVQWILDKFPEFGVKLSWNFIGKGYKINTS